MIWYIAVIILVILAFLTFFGYQLFFYKVIPQNKLTEDQLAACRKIVSEGRGYPIMCKFNAEKGICPCLPCEKMNKELKS